MSYFKAERQPGGEWKVALVVYLPFDFECQEEAELFSSSKNGSISNIQHPEQFAREYAKLWSDNDDV